MREVISHSNNGLLFTPGSAEELAACLVQLAENPMFRDELGAAARAYVQRHHDWSVVVKNILKSVEAPDSANSANSAKVG
jgi:glycosyltransferase involved in cell wall biosynthesis